MIRLVRFVAVVWLSMYLLFVLHHMSMAQHGLQQCSVKGKVIWTRECYGRVKRVREV